MDEQLAVTSENVIEMNRRVICLQDEGVNRGPGFPVQASNANCLERAFVT